MREDNDGALAEAGWNEKEIVVVLDDKAPSMVEKYVRTKTALATSLMLTQRHANENGTRMRQTRGVECQTSLNMPNPDGLIPF